MEINPITLTPYRKYSNFMNKLKIDKVIRDASGNIVGYELNSGGIIDNEQALYMAKNFELYDVVVTNDESGHEKIEGIGFKIDNLDEVK